MISQSPDSGKLLRGDTVTLVVSKGPVLVEVPQVQRMSACERHQPSWRPRASR